MIVCVCHNVNEARIRTAAAEGVQSVKGLCLATRAGTCCGKCLPEAKRILDQSVATQKKARNALERVA